MRKLTGLLVFVVALAGAIFLTRYYKQKYDTPPPAPAPTAAAPAPPSTGAGMTTAPPPSTYTDAKGNAPVSFKTQLVTLDLAAKKAHVALTLERDPARPAPASVWVWAYFFSPDAPGRYCAGDPVELRQPFAAGGGRAEVKVELPVKDCPAPRTPSSTYYARVNTSAESAFAARLAESRISYDIKQASPVVVEGAGRQ
ncbi:MAG TPA: hypothetical protein VJ866_20165 [Pyrinomonadaceae bacterium]|nr:hypothetical protein [Pyrinomonadaceae bacterium]